MAVTPHLHIGFIELVIFMLYLVIAGFIFRIVEITQHGNAVGRAMSFIY